MATHIGKLLEQIDIYIAETERLLTLSRGSFQLERDKYRDLYQRVENFFSNVLPEGSKRLRDFRESFIISSSSGEAEYISDLNTIRTN